MGSACHSVGADRDTVEERLRVATDTASEERARAETRLREMDELQRRSELERRELLSLVDSLKVLALLAHRTRTCSTL